MARIGVDMSRTRRSAAAVAAAFVLGCAGLPATGAWAKTCPTPNGSYEVTPPSTGPTEGADPAELAAADCTLGFKEDTTYPLSVIVLCILATLGTLILFRRGTSYDAIGGEA
jgi:hypothetical protein